MLHLSVLASTALLVANVAHASIISTSVFPNSACAGSASSLGGLVGVGRVVLSSGEIETHCGCPSDNLPSFEVCPSSGDGEAVCNSVLDLETGAFTASCGVIACQGAACPTTVVNTVVVDEADCVRGDKGVIGYSSSNGESKCACSADAEEFTACPAPVNGRATCVATDSDFLGMAYTHKETVACGVVCNEGFYLTPGGQCTQLAKRAHVVRSASHHHHTKTSTGHHGSHTTRPHHHTTRPHHHTHSPSTTHSKPHHTTPTTKPHHTTPTTKPHHTTPTTKPHHTTPTTKPHHSSSTTHHHHHHTTKPHHSSSTTTRPHHHTTKPHHHTHSPSTTHSKPHHTTPTTKPHHTTPTTKPHHTTPTTKPHHTTPTTKPHHSSSTTHHHHHHTTKPHHSSSTTTHHHHHHTTKPHHGTHKPHPHGPSATPRVRARQVVQEIVFAEEVCAQDERSCPAGPLGDASCVRFDDVTECGGCASIGTSTSCLSIPGVASAVCLRGGCVVRACQTGYVQTGDASCELKA